jgi:hypothetical protein
MKRFVSLLMALGLALGIASSGASPVQAAPTASAVAVNNMLGKPLPKLDFSKTMAGKHASVPKGLPVKPVSQMVKKSPCGTCYLYGGGKQTVVTDGASTQATVEKPSCTSTYCYHSLFEIALETTNAQQIVEWGWTVDFTTNGDYNPHLFSFYWVNGVPAAGGYNANFVPAVGSTCPAGMDINADVTAGSATTRLFGIQYLSGAWWMSYKGNYCGAIPGSLWTSPTYTQAGLVQLFGEVAANDTAPTGVAMGSGVLGSTTAGAKSYSYTLGTTVPAGVTPALTIFNIPSAPTHYNAVMIAPTVFRSFRYGGTW